MTDQLLPTNATSLETAVEAACDPTSRVTPGIAVISGWKHSLRPPDLLPFLVHEYGLDILLPYLDNLSDILNQGLPWSRARGTHDAVDQGLAMAGYSGLLVDPPARRLAWAEFQILLDRVRDVPADLDRISGLVDLSVPVRSTFRRGVHGYDFPAAETGYTRLGDCIVGDDSGVHLKHGAPKWSFGRSHQVEHTLTEADLTALGIWIPDVPSEQWVDMDFPWNTADLKWSEDVELARRVSFGAALAAMTCWLRFADGEGATIGYRLAACRSVAVGLNGYAFGSDFYTPSLTSPIGVHVFARTDWGDGFSQEAASVSAVFGADVADPSRPGALWLDPAGLSGGTEVASYPISIVFGETIREHVQFLMRF
ncbi:MAG: phage tail protein [Paracoccaceae bacterium]